MGCTEFLKARVPPEIKRQAKAIAERDLLTEAAWLKWPAPGFIDTLFGAMMHNEVSYGTQAFYSRVQA
jgi:hypothetical protein